MAENRKDQRSTFLAHKNTPRDYAEIGAAFVVLVGILLVLNQLDFLPQRFGVSDDMSYALVFVIGLVASISTCMAVTGGLLVAVAAKYNEASASLTSSQRMKPLVYFNAGRVVSYTLLGGAIGALGSALTLSPQINGILTIAASAVMILLGLQMLKLLPSLTRFIPTMPKALSHRIHDFAEQETKGGAFALGAATFFLPCGFTQALQLYVLAKGSFATGALTMLAFSVGTLPALMSLSAASSFATGAFQKRFLKIAGVAVVVLGFLNIQYGLVLTSSDMSAASVVTKAEPSKIAPKNQAAVPTKPIAEYQPAPSKQVAAGQQTAPMEQAAREQPAAPTKQIAVMRIVGFDYIPNRFTVTQGVPVEWRIDASEAAGCGRVLIAPKLGVRKLLSSNSSTIISFTPEETGEFGFNCGMGMMTPGSKFVVVAKKRG
jgi:sulfite exporter TauE/SafE